MIVAFGLLSMQPLWRVMYGLETKNVFVSAGAADYILFATGMVLLFVWYYLGLWMMGSA